MKMDMVVFPVGRGLSVAIITPSRHLIVYDLGNSDNLSPIMELSKEEWTKYKKHNLTYLIISHPHLDHISDIESLKKYNMEPGIIFRRKDSLDWSRINKQALKSGSILDNYKKNYVPGTYTGSVTNPPDYGNDFVIENYQLKKRELDSIHCNDSQYINNSSIITVVKYSGRTIAIGGDMEKEGMELLLGQNDELTKSIKDGVDYFVVPHHGHDSGYCPDWFEITGKTRRLNIISERRAKLNEVSSATHVCSSYTNDTTCEGENGKLYLTTKNNKAISISIDDNGETDSQLLGN